MKERERPVVSLPRISFDRTKRQRVYFMGERAFEDLRGWRGKGGGSGLP